MTPVHHAINYVEITVTDMDAAQRFYGTAFGWRFTDYAPAYAGIQAPEGDGEVGGLSLGQNVVEPGGPLVLLYSDDLDATVAAVKDAGGAIAEEPERIPGRTALHLLRPEREQARRMEHNLGNMRFRRSDQGRMLIVGPPLVTRPVCRPACGRLGYGS
jgi:uncharacterized protein